MVRYPNARSKRAEARRLEILRAAARTFRRRGFAAAGMREIAAEAGLSPGNLYHYFKGKHEILFFCQDRSLDVMTEALDAARLSGEPAEEQVRRVIRTHIRCLLDDLEGSAAHLEVEALPAAMRDRIVAKRDLYEKGVRGLIAFGVRRGELAGCDPKLVTQAILGALNWTALWFRPEGPRTAGEIGEALADYLVRGLSVGSAGRKKRARASRTAAAARRTAAGRAAAGGAATQAAARRRRTAARRSPAGGTGPGGKR